MNKFRCFLLIFPLLAWSNSVFSAKKNIPIESSLAVVTSEGPTPNVYFTLDDSGSMAWYGRMGTMTSALKAALRDFRGNLYIGAHTINNNVGQFGLIPQDNSDPLVMKRFYDWLDKLRPSGLTPLRAAARKVEDTIKSTRNTSSDVFLSRVTGKPLSCRKNFSILLSDGVWNGWFPSPRGKPTSRSFVLPNPANIKGNSTLGSGNFGSRMIFQRNVHTMTTLSDIALRQWLEDLAPNLPNDQTPYIPFKTTQTTPKGNKVDPYWIPGNNPATWQHITTYTIGISLYSPWSQAKELEVFDSGGRSSGSAEDLRYAAYAGRGKYYGVSTESEMKKAFSEIFEKVTKSSSSVNRLTGSVVSESAIDDGLNSRVFSTSLDFFSRQGDLTSKVLYDGKLSNKRDCFGSNPPKEIFVGKACTHHPDNWSVNKSMPSADKRRIFTIARDRTNVSKNGEGIEFKANELTNEQKQAISNIGGLSYSEVLNYIRGRNNSESKPGIRKRENSNSQKPVLGDIGRSNITYVGNPDANFWPKNKGYLRGKDRKPMVYVGANDGMLHAFDSDTGREVFAYAPNVLFDDFKNLILSEQPHQAFVDGKIVTQDLRADKTILVSSIGSGDKGLFALDITNPDRLGKGSVLWELDSKDDAMLGNIMGAPSIIRVEGEYKGKKDRWVVVVGSGYNQLSDDSGILVADAETGQILERLVLPSADGVSEITWIDHQMHEDDQQAGEYRLERDRGYVGDANGNLWVLDFSADKTGKTTLKSALTERRKAVPLFKATDKSGKPQAIVAKPLVVKHPINRGYLVYFGTGSLFSNKDIYPDSHNSMYAIWDDISDDFGDVNMEDLTSVKKAFNKSRTRSFLHHIEWEQAIGKLNDAQKTEVEFRGIINPKAIKWANRFDKTDSTNETYRNTTGVKANNPRYASGWVSDVGVSYKNSNSSKIPSYERAYQQPYLVRNKGGETSVVFLSHNLSVLTQGSDACGGGTSSVSTWPMAFNIDKEAGPAVHKLSSPNMDINGDGKVDKGDTVNGNSANVLGALKKGQTNNGIIFRPGKTNANSTGAGAACNGVLTTYTSSSSEGNNLAQYTICNPHGSASWKEVE